MPFCVVLDRLCRAVRELLPREKRYPLVYCLTRHDLPDLRSRSASCTLSTYLPNGLGEKLPVVTGVDEDHASAVRIV